MPDALLLDWEGCIVDTSLMRQDALQRALREEGLTLAADDCARCCEESPADMSAQRALEVLGAGDPVLLDLVRVRASRFFAERLGKGFVLREGARALLEEAHINSRVAIVTRASRSETEFVLRLSGLESAVSTVVSADDELASPPSPASFISALAQLSRRRVARPDRSIAIASSADVLRSARAAALRTIAMRAPAHIALEANGTVDTLDGLSISQLSRIAGISIVERTA